MTSNDRAQLDAEYRTLIRSLHQDTIRTILVAQTWWEGDVFTVAVSGGYDPEAVDGASDSQSATAALNADWRGRVHTALLTLVHGHPDPDVRFAADVLTKRLWSISLLLGKRRPAESDWDSRMENVNGVTVHLVHDGFTRLRRAAYHAPFRVERPVPTYQGDRTANSEPLPGRMLETIEALQEKGVLSRRSGIAGSMFDISDAVRKLSDIFFLPEDQRAAVFQQSSVEDPADEDDRPPLGFGFTGAQTEK
ncbi:hypothetical protein [Williamsia muralis]|uniref:hypothetical protein n=1 Tax=Williamsia marianensis TaxID=85044 RepID=UPI0039EAB8B4